MGTEREERDAALAELDRARSRLREVEAELEEAEQAFAALARLAREEFPDYPLADCVFTWSSASAEDVEAVRKVEAKLRARGEG